MPASNISYYEAAVWWPLGSGTDGAIQTVAASETGVYVGGPFTLCGRKPSDRIGYWSEMPASDVTQAEDANRLRLFAWPNPFAGEPRLAFDQPSAGAIRLTVHDVTGRLVSTVLDGWRPAGPGEAVWNGRLGSGETAPPGIYWIRLAAGGGSAVEKVVRIR